MALLTRWHSLWLWSVTVTLQHSPPSYLVTYHTRDLARYCDQLRLQTDSSTTIDRHRIINNHFNDAKLLSLPYRFHKHINLCRFPGLIICHRSDFLLITSPYRPYHLIRQPRSEEKATATKIYAGQLAQSRSPINLLSHIALKVKYTLFPYLQFQASSKPL